jgi:adenylyltransferase/sulfurtransferase
MLLPQIGPAGQDRLARARVLLVGCGALGCVVADQLVRAGVGRLRLADRDVVELTNLQRQGLFDEADARAGLPKAIAAAARLGRVNSSVVVKPAAVDVNFDNIAELAGVDGADAAGPRVDLIVDGTDNVQTRYLINDFAVKFAIPWIYGACVGTEGRVMAIRPGATACLRCVFPRPPAAGELPTCDTAGVLGPAAGIVGSMQSAAAIRLLAGDGAPPASLIALDAWNFSFRAIDVGGPAPDCPCCGRRQFEFLTRASGDLATTLCGRETVQIRPAGKRAVSLGELAERLRPSGDVQAGEYFVRCVLSDPAGITLTAFADGRLLVQGTTDVGRAKSLYARFLGS